MTSLLKQEMETYNAAVALLGSEDAAWQGIRDLMHLSMTGQTGIAKWAETYLRREFKAEFIRDQQDATPTKTGCVS
jgi:hypothetical protein